MLSRLVTVLSGAVIASGSLLAQASTLPPPPASAVAESVIVVPGDQYRRSAVTAWLLGSGYRDLWTMPIKVPVADLSRWAGGLTPLRVGGGATTRTLHVRGADGRRYVFRSVDKAAGQGLQEELQGTLYESILQDQISAFHPSGALVVAALLEAVSVLHTNPRLAVLPDDPRLAEFRSTFAGLLTLFEERPSETADETPGFAGANRVVATDRLFERLADSPRHRLDAREYLTARLVDLLVGDRDRSVNNWLWARFETDSGYLWRPIPRDRDQAFIRLDGVLKKRLRVYEPRLVHWGPQYSSVTGLTRNAWDMDRSFLSILNRAQWDSVIASVQRQLTDSVIEHAVRQLPPEHFARVGSFMTNSLKTRRDILAEPAKRFYEIVNRFASVYATNEADYLELERRVNGTVRVRLFSKDDANNVATASYVDRTFVPDETKEVRIYLLGGADTAVVRGGGGQEIRVRVIGGTGRDVLADSVTTGAGSTWLYDVGASTQFVRGSKTRIRRHDAPRPLYWGATAALPPDFGRRWEPFPLLGVDGDVGAVIGGTAIVTTYGFLKSPYSNRANVTGVFATGVERFRVDYSHRWNVTPNFGIRMFGRWSGFEVIRFHGFGNNTPLPVDPEFFRVIHEQIDVTPSFLVRDERRFQLEAGLTIKRSVTDTTTEETFVATSRPYGSGDFTQLGFNVRWRIDTRDRPVAASRGFYLSAEGGLSPPVFSVDETFAKISGVLATYLSPSESGDQVLALRVGGEKLTGTIPFYEAAFLGGPNTLRGIRKQRYAGDASIYGNAELRIKLANVFVLFPTEVGIVGTVDAGRVYVSGDSPGPWRASGGGGFWLAPVRRSHTVSIVFAKSSDFQGLYVRSGFLF